MIFFNMFYNDRGFSECEANLTNLKLSKNHVFHIDEKKML